jgi:hypothetical protein
LTSLAALQLLLEHSTPAMSWFTNLVRFVPRSAGHAPLSKGTARTLTSILLYWSFSIRGKSPQCTVLVRMIKATVAPCVSS